MKKSRLATLLLSMTLSAALVVPAMAGTPAEGDALGGIGSIAEYNAAHANDDPGEEDPSNIGYIDRPGVREFYGSQERFNEMFETVSAVRFHEVYRGTADKLMDQVDMTNQSTEVTSIVQIVSGYFTSTASLLNINPVYAFNSKAVTEYVESGYSHLALEPIALMQVMLENCDIDSTIYMVVDDAKYAGSVQFALEYVADGHLNYIVPNAEYTDNHKTYNIQSTAPVGMYPQPFREMYMGQMKDYIK